MSDKFDFDQFEDAPEEFDFDQFEDAPGETEIAAEQAPEASEMGATRAALTGAEQGLTFGLADELGGAMGAALEGATTFPDQDESKLNQLSRLYQEYRDFNRERAQKAEQDQPGAFMAGDVAGGLVLPGGALKSAGKQVLKAGGKQLAKSALKRKAAAAGAGVGALEAAGRTEEDLTSLEGATDVALGSAAGGLMGGILGKIGKKFSQKSLEEASKTAAKDSNIAALKSIGAKAKDMKDEFGLKTRATATLEDAKGAGKTLIDEGILEAKQGIDEVKESIVNKMEEVANQRINPAAKILDEKVVDMDLGAFSDDFNNFAQKIDNDVTDVVSGAEFAKGSDRALYKNMQEATELLGEKVDNALNSPNKIEELVNIKRQLQKQVNWDDPQANAYNEFLVKMQANVSGLINDMSQKIDPEVAKEMVDANKVYGNLTRVNRIAGDELARDLAKDDKISLGEWVTAGVVSGLSGIKALGPAVVAGKRLVEKTTKKDTGRLLNTIEAFQKARSSKNLARRAQDPSLMDEGLRTLERGSAGAREAQVGAAVLDEQQPEKPYEKNKQIGQYIEEATPETLNAASERVLEQHGKDGAKLAATLNKVAEKDRIGRRALLFSIMQDPNNRRMLGLNQEQE